MNEVYKSPEYLARVAESDRARAEVNAANKIQKDIAAVIERGEASSHLEAKMLVTAGVNAGRGIKPPGIWARFFGFRQSTQATIADLQAQLRARQAEAARVVGEHRTLVAKGEELAEHLKRATESVAEMARNVQATTDSMTAKIRGHGATEELVFFGKRLAALKESEAVGRSTVATIQGEIEANAQALSAFETLHADDLATAEDASQ